MIDIFHLRLIKRCICKCRYFVAALSVAGFYGLISTLVSIYALLKPSCSTKILSHFVIFDVVSSPATTPPFECYLTR